MTLLDVAGYVLMSMMAVIYTNPAAAAAGAGAGAEQLSHVHINSFYGKSFSMQQ